MTNLNHKWLFYLAFYGGSVPITTRKVLPVQRREEYGWVARKGGGGEGVVEASNWSAYYAIKINQKLAQHILVEKVGFKSEKYFLKHNSFIVSIEI